MEINLNLPGHDYRGDIPTSSQLDEALGEIITFLNRVGGAYLATGKYKISDQAMNLMFNAGVQLQAAKDAFSSNTGGIAVPRPAGPQPVR